MSKDRKLNKTNKMENTIIDRYADLSLGTSGRTPQALLKFNSSLKKLGFKKAVIHSTRITRDLLEKDLSIYFHPSISGFEYISHSADRSSFYEFWTHSQSLDGRGDSYSSYYGFKPCDDVIELKTEFKGVLYPVGAYLPNNNIVALYMPIRYCEWSKGKQNKYLNFVLKTIEGFFENYKIEERDISEIIRSNLLKQFTEISAKKLRDCKSSLSSTRSYIKEYSQKMTNWFGEEMNYLAQIRDLRKMDENMEGTMMDKLDELKTLKFIKNFDLNEKGICFDFPMIHIEVKEEDIEMGEYQIEIMPSTIKITNKQFITMGSSDVYHSCHIHGSSICFGRQKDMVYKLLGQMEYKKLAHFLYVYLKSYNPEDTYLSMNYWIKAKENGGQADFD